jgi:hypothetical protein
LLAWPTFEGRRKEVIKEGKKGRKKERKKENPEIVLKRGIRAVNYNCT